MLSTYDMNKIYALRQHRISAARLLKMLGPAKAEELANMLYKEVAGNGGRWQVRIAPCFAETGMLPIAMIEEAWEHGNDLEED